MFVFSNSPIRRFAVLLSIVSAFFLAAVAMPEPADAASAKSSIIKKKIAKKKAKDKKARSAKREVQAKAVYCVDLAANRALLARNPDKRLPVASLTKLMTALVTLEHMSLDQKVRVPEHVKSIPKSVVGLKPDDLISVKDVLHGLLMASGNDCAETLACAFPGGREKFIEAMNKKARAIGMRHSAFHSPSGLDHKTTLMDDGRKTVKTETNISTAREMAMIARVAFADPTVRTISLKRHHVIAGSKGEEGYSVRNTNKLLRDNLPIKGGKTGYTANAGHCLVTEFAPGRNVFLIVVLGSPDHFRDTRLVYQKALEKAKAEATKSPAPSTRHGNRGPRPFAG